jgi:hypothetical protein
LEKTSMYILHSSNKRGVEGGKNLRNQ